MPTSDSELLGRLRAEARTAERMTWVPYTRFAVFAAVRTTSGEYFGGSNVENANITLSKHAEETAIIRALAGGALVGSDGRKQRQCIDALYTTATLCGSCRQFLWEFAVDDCVVYVDGDGSENAERHLLQDLLPDAFGPEHQGVDSHGDRLARDA